MRKLFILTLTLLLAACNIPPSFQHLISHTPTGTPSPEPCSLNWATHPLPELSSRVQSALDVKRLTNVRVKAEAYGEDCSVARTNQSVSFTALETDFRLTVPVKDLKDREQMGSLLESILVVLDGFPPSSTPDPQPGYIGITFQAGSNELHLWFTEIAGKSARTEGLHGAALLDKLNH
jgi:hypothetical protein